MSFLWLIQAVYSQTTMSTYKKSLLSTSISLELYTLPNFTVHLIEIEAKKTFYKTGQNMDRQELQT